MKVYHGGSVEVTAPLVEVGRPNLDFGRGFYVTDILPQAKSWAEKVALRKHDLPIINVYEFDYSEVVKKCSYKRFYAYDDEWLEFIVSNRKGGKEWRKFDVIEGGVADDRVVDTIEAYISGMATKDWALQRLKTYAPNNQICITNQEVVQKYLKFLKSYNP
ncbi:MAG: DUF3990 domain-containing protein [Bacteroidales bacterium]|nr:DUF3990 domain-containing protein [Bacteroidales bacterium]